MQYMRDSDYAYIMGKYHDGTRPAGKPSNRFVRRDHLFSAQTGLHGDVILEEILRRDEEISHLPHAIRKANAFAFVLDHTRIACDSRDRFPAINMVDAPLGATLMEKWKKEVFHEIIPETGERRVFLRKSGIATLLPDYDHSVPFWDRLFSLGFAGILEESEKIRTANPRTEEEDAFFESIRITYTAIIRLVKRLADLAAETEGSQRMGVALQNLAANPPASFYEALLLNYLYFMLSEHIEGLQVRSLGNFDRLFFPYFERDLQRGVSEEEIRTDLAYFFLQFTAIGNYWNQPVFLGGCKADESTEINALSYLFLDVYDRMKIYNPKIQIKVADSTPKEFLLKALDMIRRGNNCIVFVSDATVRTALVRTGATEEEARLCNIRGCYEYIPQCAIDCGMNYLNSLKPLEYALHEGCDGVTGAFALRKSPPVRQYTCFDDFYAEYKKQLCATIDAAMQTVNTYENYMAYINPLPLLSATYPPCLKNAKDALAGGAAYNDTTLAFGFMADLADSLAMLKKYVFDRQELTLEEFVNILDANYEGHELFRRKLLSDRDKYGNNKDLPDFFAKDIADFVTRYVVGKPNAKTRGGSWNLSFHVARMSYSQGQKTAASPNGRLLGEELSKNLSASMGQNREGATAAVLSITKIDATAFAGDACLDMGLLPAAVKGNAGLEAMYSLLRTFVKRGGHAVHMNVFDAETLRDAQKHPEKYTDLQIRVCGWNVLWNNIVKEEQDGFIRQAESLA